ncbi:MAG TPA: HD domain-containing protein [Euryarchaeota archaeon]|nr:MAG: hypothetical protein B6U90_03915 [Thermoplasmatales archaeon ex4484_6]RLF65736.1 MAG: hypothetical protein DRN57_08515 [Thermoplasmata archaeon]HHD16600.1 HD domain-containing protein [Euryarchaeota archaeon]
MIREEDVSKLFGPQLEMIGNPEIRDKVVTTWVLGCRKGGWEDVDELLDIPFTLLTDTYGINLVEHTIAVTEGAIGLALAQKETYGSMPYEVDMDRLVAGGILHDVGKLLEIEKLPDGTYAKSRSGKLMRHPISGSLLAAEAGLPDDYINTIACHAKEGEGRPKVLETVLIHQADFATFDPLVMKKKDMLIE